MAEAISIPNYVIDGEIGRGAMSVVYKGTRDGKGVAIKVMRDSPAAGSLDAILHFRREAAALARLNHPGLVRIFEMGEAGDRPYLVMELVEGTDLASILRHGPLREELTLKYGRTLAGALAEVHRHGLVHRDLKPSNIVIDSGGEARLVDFGFVAETAGAMEGRPNVVGTFLYSAPEQTGMLKRALDGRADLYSLGAVLFECCSARPPFQTDSIAELMHQHAAVRAPSVRELNPEVRPVLSSIIEKLLAKDPDDRYQTGEGLLADLESIVNLESAQRAGKTVVLGSKDVKTVDRDLKLVGRDAELELVRSAWEQAQKSSGVVCLIEGEPGSGKTRLVKELTRSVEGSGTLVIVTRSQRSEQIPLGPVREAIDEYVSRLLRMPEAEKEVAEHNLVKAAGDLAPVLRHLCLGLETILKDDGSSPPKPTAEQFYEAVATFIANLYKEYQGIFIADGVQWLDVGSIQVIHRLASKLESTPLLLLLTTRSDSQNQQSRNYLVEGLGKRLSKRIALKGLSVDAVAELISAYLGGQGLERAFTEKLAARADGNPFAVCQYLRALLDNSALKPVGGQWQVDSARLAQVALPTDVLDLVVSRVSTLTPKASEILRWAAVIGMSFSRELLDEAVPVDSEVINQALAEAIQSNLVERSDEENHSFVHDRIRGKLLEGLSDEAKRHIHQAIAGALEKRKDNSPAYVFALARHYANGHADKNLKRIYETNFAAGMQSLAIYANADAYNFLTSALDAARKLECPNSVQADIEAALGQACTLTARVNEAIEHFNRALELATSRLVRARLHASLCRVQAQLFNFEGISSECRKALAELGQSLPTSRAGIALSNIFYQFLAWLAALLGIRLGLHPGPRRDRYKLLAEVYSFWAFFSVAYQYRFSSWLLHRLLHVLQHLGDSREAIEPLATCAFAYAGTKRGIAMGLRATKLAEKIGEKDLIALAYCRLVWAYQYAGDCKTADDLVKENLSQRGKWLSARDYVASGNHAGLNLISRGLTREAGEVLKLCLAMADGTQLPSAMATIRAPLAAAEAFLGQMTDATAHFNDAQEIRVKRVSPKDLHVLAWASEFGTLLYLEQDELGNRFEQLIDDREALGRGPRDWAPFQQFYYVVVAYARLRQFMQAPRDNRTKEYARLLSAVQALKQVAYEPLKRSHYLIVQAALEREEGRLARAQSHLEEAWHLCDISSNAWGLFEVGVERARVAAARGDNATAADEARRALQIALDHGWRNRVRRIRKDFSFEEFSPRRSNGTSSHAGARASSSGATAGSERYLNALLQVSLASSSSLHPKDQARAALDEIVRLLGAERALLFLVNPETNELELLVGRGTKRKDLKAVAYSTTVVNKVREERKPLVVTGTEEGALLGSDSAVAHQLRSIVGAPLLIREKLIGVIYIDNSMIKGLFTEDDVGILLAIANHVAISVETARSARLEMERQLLKKDLELTAAVQSLFLPESNNYRNGKFEVFGFYRPAEQCGGDWWWYDQPSKEELSVLVGDVTGHGPAAAMLTASVATGFRMTTSMNGISLADTIGVLNDDVIRLCRGKHHMTLAALSLNKQQSKLTVLSAGAPPLFILSKDGRVESVASPGSPLGTENFALGRQERPLDAQRIFVFTDGLPELELPTQKQLGMRKLSAIFKKTHGLGIQDASTLIVDELDAARAGVPQPDDLTFALVDIHESST